MDEEEKINYQIEYSYISRESNSLDTELVLIHLHKDELLKTITSLKGIIKSIDTLYPNNTNEDKSKIIEDIEYDINYLYFAIELFDKRMNEIYMQQVNNQNDINTLKKKI